MNATRQEHSLTALELRGFYAKLNEVGRLKQQGWQAHLESSFMKNSLRCMCCTAGQWCRRSEDMHACRSWMRWTG